MYLYLFAVSLGWSLLPCKKVCCYLFLLKTTAKSRGNSGDPWLQNKCQHCTLSLSNSKFQRRPCVHCHSKRQHICSIFTFEKAYWLIPNPSLIDRRQFIDLYIRLYCRYLTQELEGSKILLPIIPGTQKLSASAKCTFHFMDP